MTVAGCAHGIEDNSSSTEDLTSGAGGTNGAAGATVGAAGDGTTIGSGGSGSDVDANTTGPGGSSVTVGAGGTGIFDGGSGGGAGGSQPVVDSSGMGGSVGVGGAGGNGGSGVGFDAREATVDSAPDASIDAPPEAGCTNPTQCALKAALVHRYSFNGTGTTATDSVGNANGTVVGTTLSGNGSVIFAGGTSDQYVDLPNGIIRQLTNATLEIWLTWSGGAAWQRVFDFGNATGDGGTQGMASTSLYLTPLGGGPTVMFAALKRSDQVSTAETRALTAAGLATGPLTQLAVVVDDTNNQLLIYRNGAVDGSVALTDSLSVLTDVNNWLGRSQYVADPHFGGTIYEFRIYNVALSQASLQVSFAGGTDPAFLN